MGKNREHEGQRVSRNKSEREKGGREGGREGGGRRRGAAKGGDHCALPVSLSAIWTHACTHARKNHWLVNAIGPRGELESPLRSDWLITRVRGRGHGADVTGRARGVDWSMPLKGGSNPRSLFLRHPGMFLSLSATL